MIGQTVEFAVGMQQKSGVGRVSGSGREIVENGESSAGGTDLEEGPEAIGAAARGNTVEVVPALLLRPKRPELR